MVRRVAAMLVVTGALLIAPTADAALVQTSFGGRLDDPNRHLRVRGDLIYDPAGVAAGGVTAESLRLEVLERDDPVLTLTGDDELDQPQYPFVTSDGLDLAAFAVDATFAELGPVQVDVIVDGRELFVLASLLAPPPPGLERGTLLGAGTLDLAIVPLPGAFVLAASGLGALVALGELGRARPRGG